MYIVTISLMLCRELNVASSTITDPGLRHLISTEQVHEVQRSPMKSIAFTKNTPPLDP